MKKILICGDREWKNREVISEVLKELPAGSLIIHGDARGADRLAAEIATEMGFPVEAHPANWSHGLHAGPIRNREMLDRGPDIVIAFHDNIDASKGTRNMVSQARSKGVQIRVVTSASVKVPPDAVK